MVRTLEWAAVALVVFDLVTYLVLVFGLGNRLRKAQQQREEIYHRIRMEAGQVARLERYAALLPDVEQQLQSFQQERVPSRRRGFSRGARLVRKVADNSGVELAGVAYKLYSQQGQPLERLAMNVAVEGPYPGLVKFARGLETANDFVVVREFSLQPLKGGSLGLRISADLYLTP